MFSHAPPTRWPRLLSWVSGDVVGGILMIGAPTVGLIWANSPWQGSYQTLSAAVVGPAAVHLDLSLAAWAGDGLLAIFFFVVGMELKHEMVAGSLRNPPPGWGSGVRGGGGDCGAGKSTLMRVALG